MSSDPQQFECVLCWHELNFDVFRFKHSFDSVLKTRFMVNGTVVCLKHMKELFENDLVRVPGDLGVPLVIGSGT